MLQGLDAACIDSVAADANRMSYSCWCCVSPSTERLEGTNWKKLVKEEEEDEEEEEDRRNMEISLLREQYRSTRDRQKQHTQMLLFRRVSEELSEAVSIIPFTQSLMLSWEPNSNPQPALTSDPDPWHIHLGFQRCSCPAVSVQLPASSPETTNTIGSSSSLQESRGRKLSVGPTSDSPCSSVSSTNEEDLLDADRPRIHPVQPSVGGSPNACEEDPSDGSVCSSFSDSHECSTVVFDEPSAPITSSTSSASNIPQDLTENEAANVQTSNGVLQSSSTAPWRGSRKFSALSLRFTRQLSVGGLGSSTEIQQNQNHYPFPSRKIPRISEAARRLGMYSSF
ncbi:hypothetical protein PAMP_010850 [Pampus punctatissimus]